MFENFTPEVRLALGAGIMGGQNFGQGLANGVQMALPMMQQKKEEAQAQFLENKTRQWLQQQYPGEDFNTMTPDMVKLYANEAMKKRFAPPEKAEFKQLDDGTYGAWDGSTFKKLGSAPKPIDLPAIADEYNWMKSQGYKGSPEEYQAWKANLSKSGFMVEQTADGFRVVQGSVNAPPKLTEAQSKDVNFLTRAKKAEADLAPVENELTSWAQKQAQGLPMDLGNYAASPNYQKAQQAGREILAIILRKDTGAAVTPSEFETYGKIYLPQPGDSKETIAAKKQSRETAIKAIQSGLGPLAPQDEEAKPNPGGAVDYREYFK